MNSQEATTPRAGVPRQAFAVIARLDADDDCPAASGWEALRIVPREGTVPVPISGVRVRGGDPV